MYCAKVFGPITLCRQELFLDPAKTLYALQLKTVGIVAVRMSDLSECS